jgi:predicted Rossmann fold nucleotide-binding protein DprA/Smf involved in DNA uptake
MAEETAKKTSRALEQLKQLRQERAEDNKRKAERQKEQNRLQKAVLDALADAERTVPEIAEVTGLDTQTTLWWVTALRKYNKVETAGKRGDYPTYRRK